MTHSGGAAARDGPEHTGVGEPGEVAEEGQPAALMKGEQAFQKRRRKKRDRTRTGRKKPGLQAIQRSPSGDSRRRGR